MFQKGIAMSVIGMQQSPVNIEASESVLLAEPLQLLSIQYKDEPVKGHFEEDNFKLNGLAHHSRRCLFEA